MAEGVDTIDREGKSGDNGDSDSPAVHAVWDFKEFL